MSFRYSKAAQEDITTGFSYIAERAPDAAQRARDALDALLDRLDAGDFEGAEKTLTTGEKVRAWSLPPWWVYYQRQGDELFIVRILHHARRPIIRKPRRRKK